MTIIRTVLFIVALLCGLIGMGCWTLLQLVTRDQGPGTFLTMCGSAVVAGIALGIMAFLRERKYGFCAVLQRTLFLVAICGLAVSAPPIILSWELIGVPFLFLLVLVASYIVAGVREFRATSHD
jgi:hypothetical protein